MKNNTHSKAIWVALAIGLQCLASMTYAEAAAPMCKAKALATWKAKSTKWAGPCQKALAQGHGALRLYSGGKITSTFYGEFRNGEPSLGVEEMGSNFKAGRVERGQFVKSDDRQTYIDAFKAAEKGALAAESQFTAVGNQPSATFYREKASVLAAQMD
ncbi:MAG: hypothetical protein RJB60_415 [Pseudomonadota bacterium]|jgi:hypothetical protein